MKIETLPSDLNDISKTPISFNQQLKKSISEPDIFYENDINCEYTPRLEVSRSTKKKLSERLKNLRWKYFFVDVFLKEICIFSILILIIESQNCIQKSIYCKMDNSNIFFVIYTILREIFFVISYYFLFSYYAFKLCWPLACDKQSIILSLLVSLFLYFLKIYNIDSNGNNFDIYIVCLILQCLRVIAVYRRKIFLWENMKTRNFPLFSLLGFCLLFHQYAMKNSFIPNLKGFFIQFIEYSVLGNFIFQLFLYIYFRIYYRIFFYILMMYTNLQNDSIGKNGLQVFSKFFLIDVVSSSVPGAISASLLNFGSWMGIFNTLYQILVLYDQNFDILRNLRFLFWKLLKKAPLPSQSNEQEKYVREILKSSLSLVLLMIGVHLILWFSFRKTIDYWVIVENCEFSLKDFVEIRIENILILSSAYFLLYLGLTSRKNDPLKLDWELEFSSFFFNLYYNIILHFIVDNVLQYYFSFYYLKINSS